MRDLLVTAIVFGSVPFVLWRPWIGILVWAWISYMNPHRFTFDFAYNYPFAQVVAIATLAGLLMSSEPKRFPWTPTTVIWLMFVVWMNVTTLFALNPEGAVPEWERAMKVQLMTIATVLLITTRQRLYFLVWAIVLSLGFFGAKGGVFSLMTGGQYLIMGPPYSFISENNTLGLALIMVLPLMRYLFSETPNRLVRVGLLGLMVLTALSIATSYSRGAFLAACAMVLLLWLKGPHKVRTAAALLLLIPAILAFMPEKWYERMQTIQTFEQDVSAMGRINAWGFALNLALDRPLVGGGYLAFTPALFEQYAPQPDDFHDAHSIYFEVLGEHGFVGLALFLALLFATFRLAGRIVRETKARPDLSWAKNLAAMVQASVVGYAVGGAFLGLAYFDLYYHLVALAVLLNRHVAETSSTPAAVARDQPSSLVGKPASMPPFSEK